MVFPDDIAMYDGDYVVSEGEDYVFSEGDEARMMVNMITEVLYLYVIPKSLHYV